LNQQSLGTHHVTASRFAPLLGSVRRGDLLGLPTLKDRFSAHAEPRPNESAFHSGQ